MRNWQITAQLGALLGVLGCASTPQQGSASILLVRDQATVKNCQRLGAVRANSLLTGIVSAQGYDNLITDLKNQTAALGGTHVLVFDFTSNYASNNAAGDAYRCAPQ
jgi:hypothetical protein